MHQLKIDDAISQPDQIRLHICGTKWPSGAARRGANSRRANILIRILTLRYCRTWKNVPAEHCIITGTARRFNLLYIMPALLSAQISEFNLGAKMNKKYCIKKYFYQTRAYSLTAISYATFNPLPETVLNTM